MAAQRDGSVVITTLLDISGVKTGVKGMSTAVRGATAGVVDLEKAFGRLSASASKLGTVANNLRQSFAALGNTAGKIGGLAKVFGNVGKAATQQFTGIIGGFGGVGRAATGLSSTIRGLGLAIGGAFAVKKLVDFGKESIELGSNLEEVQNVVDVTFTTMNRKVDEFAKTAANVYGLSETMAKQFVGTFGAMSKAFGFTEQQAYDMSTTLAGLAGDVASFYNIDQDTAFTKLKAVFSGETEALKDLGIVMTQTALDQYALQQGIGRTTSKMTEQEKVALRYQFILDQLSGASGDFARTSEGWANQTRILKLNVDSLKASFGAGLINVLTPALKLVNSIISRLATLASAFKSFTELLTGRKSSGNASAANNGMAAGYQAASDSAQNAAGSIGDLTSATNDNTKAAKAAEKAQNKYLSRLDEVQKFETREAESLSGGSGGSGGGGGGLAGLSDAVDTVDYGKLAEGKTVADKLADSFAKLAEIIEKKDWKALGEYMAQGINTGLQKVYDAIKWENVGPKISAFIEAFTQTFNSLVKNINWELLGRTIGAGLNTVVKTLLELVKGIDWKSLGNGFGDGIMGAFREIDFRALGELLGERFMIAWRIFGGIVERIDPNLVGRRLAQGLISAFNAINWIELGNILSEGINKAVAILRQAINYIPWGAWGAKMAAGANNLQAKINWTSLGELMGEGIESAIEFIGSAIENFEFGKFGTHIGELLEGVFKGKRFAGAEHYLAQAFNGVLDAINGALDVFENGELATIGKDIGEAINNLVNYEIDWDKAGRTVKRSFGWVLKQINFAVNAFEFDKLGTNIAGFINEAFDGFNLDLAASTFTTAVNGVFDAVEAFASESHWEEWGENVYGAINTAIHGINWEENGAAFNHLLEELGDFFTDVVEHIDWEGLGEDIGKFFSQIDWGKHLKNLFDVLLKVLGGIFRGLGKTSGGRLVAGLIAFKVTTSMVMPFINNILTAFGSDTIGQKIGKRFAKIFTKGVADAATEASTTVATDTAASTAISGLGSAIVTLLSKAVAPALAIAFTLDVASAVTKAQDAASGGNGEISLQGTAMDALIKKMVELNLVTRDNIVSGGEMKTTLFDLKEQMESAGMSSEQQAQVFGQAFAAMGLSVGDVQKAIDALDSEYGSSTETMALLNGVIANFGETAKQTSAEFNLAAISGSDMLNRLKGDVAEFTGQGRDAYDVVSYLETALNNPDLKDCTAEQVVDYLKTKMEEAGVPTQILSDYLARAFPESVTKAEGAATDLAAFLPEKTKEASDKAKGNIGGAGTFMANAMEKTKTKMGTALETAKNYVSSKTEAAKKAAESNLGAMATDAETNLGKVATTAETKLGKVKEYADLKVGALPGVMDTAGKDTNTNALTRLREMVTTTSTQMEAVYDTYKIWWNAVKTNADNFFSVTFIPAIEGWMTSLNTAISNAMSPIGSSIAQAFWGLPNGISAPLNAFAGKLNFLLSAVENVQHAVANLLSFDFSVPRTYGNGMVQWIDYWSRVPQRFANYRVPYLAKGAVIPPNAPFMAVLGDQKSGKNIETPVSTMEDSFRKILQEFQNTNRSGGSYQFVAQLDRRTLFDEFISEAKIRKLRSGRNPLELA